jgi:hypothetical protein
LGLLVLLRLCCGCLAATTARTAATATAPSAARCLLLLAIDHGRAVLRLLFGALRAFRTRRAFRSRRARLLRLLRALSLTLLLLLRTFSVALALLLLLRLLALRVASGTTAAAALLAFRGRFSGALLEVAHLLLHEAARLCVLFRAELVVAAVRATFPPFRICTFTA